MPDFQWYPLNFHLIKNVEYASKNVQFGYNIPNLKARNAQITIGNNPQMKINKNIDI